MKTRDQDHKIMGILNVTEISRVICDTNMGTLKLRIRKGETAYKFVLDAVELPKDLNNELMEAIYPSTDRINITCGGLVTGGAIKVPFNDKAGLILGTNEPKGRPKGAKNKTK